MDKKIKSPDIRFMKDSTEGKDGAKEVIMDYVISWTLRRAQNSCAHEKPTLYKCCRKLLGFLLDIDIQERDEVLVETWKQDYRIDLWVWAKINDTEYDILIEDKYYTGLHDDQLARYKEQFDEWLDKNRPHSQRVLWVLTCYEKGDTDIYNSAKGLNFRIGFWDDMLIAMGCEGGSVEDTESDIFNEFWLRAW